MRAMRVLVACEVSGRVRDAFLKRGVDAISCDVQPSQAPGPHIVGRVEDALQDDWDLVVAFPPCTYLSNANANCVANKCGHPDHTKEWSNWRQIETINAALLFQQCRAAGRMSAVENPTPHPFARQLMGEPTAQTQPYWFGDPWLKHTRWWLRGLQPLQPTRLVTPTTRLVSSGGKRRKHTPNMRGHVFPGWEVPPPKRSKSLVGQHRDPGLRSMTPLGLADAIADQWSQPNQTLFG